MTRKSTNLVKSRELMSADAIACKMYTLSCDTYLSAIIMSHDFETSFSNTSMANEMWI